MLHGATDNGLCWTPVARALMAEYDVVLPDARGHGQSDAPAEGYTSVERAADMADLIKQLGLGRPAVIGHSMGAQTALRLAAEYPELVRCAVLEDPPLRERDASLTDLRARMRAETAANKQRSQTELIEQARNGHPLWSEDELPAWAEAKRQVSDAFLESFRGSTEPPWLPLVERVSVPTLLVTADPELGAIVTPETAAHVQQLNPKIEIVRLTGAGHNIRREQFQPFMRAISAFLRQHGGA
jgi:pimeloyl-ACP methyl ester carboxylesterase